MQPVPYILPASTRSLAAGVPPAPRGTLFALGAHGGYAVPPRPFTLYFGRDSENVHVLVGKHDNHISRRHGELVCDGHTWSMRNHGGLPIWLPGDTLLLKGNEMPLGEGYLPLLIGASRHRQHLVEIHVVRGPAADDDADADSKTVSPVPYWLSHKQKLVLTALALRYLRQDKRPQPLSWKEVAAELNQAPGGGTWTWRQAAHVVAGVRAELSAGTNRDRKDEVEGLLREEGAADPLANTLNHTLIVELLRTTTLLPTDLRLLNPDT